MEQCDLIMKGGVTSGVVYPKVITELAKKFRFVNLGGTSAGAIGAGFAAAAEYGRSQGEGDAGFTVLDKIPEELGAHLSDLFEASPEHRKTLKYLKGVIGAGKLKIALSSVWNLYRIIQSFKTLPGTRYGLCTGLSANPQENLALTDWMNLWLERAAGRSIEDGALPVEPLTFGMLRNNGITLRTITTNLSQRMPVNLPNIGSSFVRKSDLVAFMPSNIVRYIESIQGEIDSSTEIKDRDSYYLLPTGDLMPVLLGIRLSLSFPILLAAFPIYRVDYSKRKSLCPDAHMEPDICWLTDGGISSNFPIHLFDSILPTRPTFGIQLKEFEECRQEPDVNSFPRNRVYLPMKAGQGQTLEINPVGGVVGFMLSLFSSAQNWQDNSQSHLAGYRERIIRIALKPSEGGLNLEMSADQIGALTNVGKQAGVALREEFSFAEHRWRRMLSAYAAMEQALEDLKSSYSSGSDTMDEFLSEQIAHFERGDPEIDSYHPDDIEHIRTLKERMRGLVELSSDWQTKPLRDVWSMPKPSSVLKITPEQFLN